MSDRKPNQPGSVATKFYIGVKTSDGYKFDQVRSRSFPTIEQCRERITEIRERITEIQSKGVESIPTDSVLISFRDKASFPLSPDFPLPPDFLVPVSVVTTFYSK
jgi:hypothetical protein